ncbi:uncharacterized protein LOC143188163 [Calliopsis andreniformis]|uniref:uncharacterized protein LOC143188163 n=1 Tax=Calliopsis andreniformis TaxID=337506 RepID=UPI003FCE5DC6
MDAILFPLNQGITESKGLKRILGATSACLHRRCTVVGLKTQWFAKPRPCLPNKVPFKVFEALLKVTEFPRVYEPRGRFPSCWRALGVDSTVTSRGGCGIGRVCPTRTRAVGNVWLRSRSATEINTECDDGFTTTTMTKSRQHQSSKVSLGTRNYFFYTNEDFD